MSRRWIASAALAAALVLTGGRQMSAQDVPRMANGKPDFSGMYTPPSTVKGTGPRGNLIFNADKMAPVKPGAESLLYRPRTGDARLDEPRAMCLPAGFPSGMLYILPIQIVQNPKHIVIIPGAPARGADHPDRRPGAPDRDRALVLRRFSRQVGRRHTGHRDRQLQAVDPGRLPLHGPDQEPLAHRCASHHRASDARRQQAAVPHHHRRPQDLHAALLAGFRADASARLGVARPSGVRVRGEQPLRGRQLPPVRDAVASAPRQRGGAFEHHPPADHLERVRSSRKSPCDAASSGIPG